MKFLEIRTNRKAYLLAWVAMIAISYLFAMVASIVLSTAPMGTVIFVVSVFAIVGNLAIAYFGVGRLHDLGLSGWYYLAVLIPYINMVLLLLLLLYPGKRNNTKYDYRYVW